VAAFYNEHDKGAAQWLRELIKDGLIADGVVDERDIRDIAPADLDGFTQCHFFAGIGGWPLGLRMANWPDDRPVWTGSCPCQPFSVAGKGGGVDDERHLWPAFRWLIAQRRPASVFGEQVASRDGREWVAGVHADLEAMGYVCGVADMCAAGFGAAHIRQRLWWVAYGDGSGGVRNGRQSDEPEEQSIDQHPSKGVDFANSAGPQGPHEDGGAPRGIHSDSGKRRGASGVADADEQRSERQAKVGKLARGRSSINVEVDWSRAVWWPCRDGKARRVPARWVEDADRGRDSQSGLLHADIPPESSTDGGVGKPDIAGSLEGQQAATPTGQRGTTKPAGDNTKPPPARHGRLEVEPALFPLADGIPGRVGLLRGAGNAIVPQVAKAFIEAAEGAREEIGGKK